MKILHTADWHLGAKTEGRNRIQEQREVMAEIIDLANKEKIDLVIIAGDVFDQAIPSSEAEDLFYETMESLSAKGDRAIVVIAGNHDDPKRLTAGDHFAVKHNVILAGDLQPKVAKLEFKKGSILSSYPGSVEVQIKTPKGQEKCVVAMLPYPSEYRFQEQSKEDSYAGKVKDWARIVCKGFKKDSTNILASHLMLVGARDMLNGKDVTLRVGDINAVSKSDLPQADYYALGHIHTYQLRKGNYCYSGAPMFFSFDQSVGDANQTAGVVILQTKPLGGIKSVEYHQLKTPAKMVEIEAKNIDEARTKLKNFQDRDIVNLTFVQDKPLSMALIKELKSEFACLTKVLLKLVGANVDDKNYVNNRAKLETSSLFVEFYKQKKQVEPSRELIGLFKSLLEEENSETN